MPFTHRIRVRYGECDMQRVVFNANYFAYCDDAVDSWMRHALSTEMKTADPVVDLHDLGFDFMLKSATMTWHAPVRFAETIDLGALVARWGTSSFDVRIDGRVGDEVRFEATITYVSIDPTTQRPAPVPAFVKSALERPS